MSESSRDFDGGIRDFKDRLEATGVHRALGFLNARTRHRFTGVYRFDAEMLRCHCLFDRENPSSRAGTDLVLRDSYCGIVAECGEPLEIEDAATDSRLEGHPARSSILAYQGVPLRMKGRPQCVGTLCHWDVRPRLLAPDELFFLRVVAPVIAHALGWVEPETNPSGPESNFLPPRSKSPKVRFDDEADQLHR